MSISFMNANKYKKNWVGILVACHNKQEALVARGSNSVATQKLHFFD